MSTELPRGPIEHPIHKLNAQRIEILGKYRSAATNPAEARGDALALARNLLHASVIEITGPTAKPGDFDIASDRFKVLTNVLLDVESGNWDSMHEYLRSEARSSFLGAQFRINTFGDKQNAEIAENEANNWLNLAKSILNS